MRLTPRQRPIAWTRDRLRERERLNTESSQRDHKSRLRRPDTLLSRALPSRAARWTSLGELHSSVDISRESGVVSPGLMGYGGR